MRPYRPIPCEVYGRLELAIMHGERLRLVWCGRGGGLRVERWRPLDLRTRAHAEYLIGVGPGGVRRVLRLDRLRAFRTA
ncbi:transcriptional antiterminator, Rof [Inmirania thermothiophila]|uniref:Rho-binding antiterminator n=1 Tax=Inmirania thermothiophila TaxID=1750597 RepID=A0A3N1Y949_9GAMM|nr:transcriptional antiterminator, Rof [Inmirania thermothiophila]ROR34132.1 Rho-binding antiterminator [Inmirania thermothiophila]